MKNIIIGQSGGPTSVINASLAGVYKEAKKQGYNKVYGMVNGIEGFLNENIVDLDKYLKDKTNYELLKRTPSSFLGSCRYKLPSYKDDKKTYEKIFSILEKHKIDSMIYIGGNDSMDTVKMLSDYAKSNHKKQNFIGVPKTIDNDLPIIDHCPGFASCAKYIATSLKEIIRDNSVYGDTKKQVCIVEIMGRHAGWLTASSSLAKDKTCEGVDLIYLPEVFFDKDDFVKKVKNLLKVKSSVVIAVSEGIKTKDGKFVCEINSVKKTDAFGHKELSGTSLALADLIKNNIDVKTRAIELSTLQRSAAHIQSLIDLKEAEKAGMMGAKLAYQNKSGLMVIYKRISNKPYKIKYSSYDIHDIANIEKKVPLEWIDTKNNYVKQDLIDYMKPLIQGEVKQIYEDGLPKHIVL